MLEKIETTVYKVVRGVPQGSVLGPLLFKIAIGSVLPGIKEATAILFADDMKLVFEILEETYFEKAENELRNISMELRKMGLEVNSAETNVIRYGKKTEGSQEDVG